MVENPLWNLQSDAEFKHLLREMEASGLKTGSMYQKSDHATRNRRPSKPRSSKGQFKSKATKLSYRRAPKQTSGRRTISLLQAVNEAVKSAKVRTRSIIEFQVKWGQKESIYSGIGFCRHSFYLTKGVLSRSLFYKIKLNEVTWSYSGAQIKRVLNVKWKSTWWWSKSTNLQTRRRFWSKQFLRKSFYFINFEKTKINDFVFGLFFLQFFI